MPAERAFTNDPRVVRLRAGVSFLAASLMHFLIPFEALGLADTAISPGMLVPRGTMAPAVTVDVLVAKAGDENDEHKAEGAGAGEQVADADVIGV